MRIHHFWDIHTSASSSTHNIHREIYYESFQIKQNLNCNYTFPIDMAPCGIFYGAKSIGKGNSNLVKINKIKKILLVLREKSFTKYDTFKLVISIVAN